MDNLWCRGTPRHHIYKQKNYNVQTQNFASQQETQKDRNNFTFVHKKVGFVTDFFYF
jgi:hypothetical protein